MGNVERSETGRVEGGLPPIPAKRYFTIGEVSELCLVKPYVLRYWEQEFAQLRPMKRRGNRRYYQHHEVLLIRRIRELLYERGFTISGARNELAAQGVVAEPARAALARAMGVDGMDGHHMLDGADESGLRDGAALADVAIDTRQAGRVRVPARAAAWAPVAAQPLMATPAVASGSLPTSPDLAGLSSASPESVAALRETLLSIRDLLA